MITSYVIRSHLFIQSEFISDVLQFQDSLFVSAFALFSNDLDSSQKKTLSAAFCSIHTSQPCIHLLLLEMEMIIHELDPSSLFLSSLLPLPLSRSFSFASSLHFDVTAFRLLNNSLFHNAIDSSLLSPIAAFASSTKDKVVLTSLLNACSQFHSSNTTESESWSLVEETCLISLGRWSEVELKNDGKKNCMVAFKERSLSKVLLLTENQNEDYFRRYRICAFLLQEQYDQMHLEFQKWDKIPSPQWEDSDTEEEGYFFFSVASSLHSLLHHHLQDAVQTATNSYASYLQHHILALRHTRSSLVSVPLLAFLHQYSLFLQQPKEYSFAFLHHSFLSAEENTKWSLLLSFRKIIYYSCSLLHCSEPRDSIDSFSQSFCCLRLRMADQMAQSDKDQSERLIQEVLNHSTTMMKTATGSELSEWTRIRDWARVKEMCLDVRKEELKEMMKEMEGMYRCPELFEGYKVVDDLIQTSFPSITSSPEYIHFLIASLHCLSSSSSHPTILHHLLHSIHTSSSDSSFVAQSIPICHWRLLFPSLIHSFLHRTQLWGEHSFQSMFYSALFHYFVSDASVAKEILLPLLEQGTKLWSDEVKNDYLTKYSRCLESALLLQKGFIQLQDSKFCSLYKLVRPIRTEDEARAALPEIREILEKPNVVLFCIAV